LNADGATRGLLEEWLTSAGYAVLSEKSAEAEAGLSYAFVIVDVPYTRSGAVEMLKLVSAKHPGTPILAMSPTFFSNVACGGNCARALGVAGVLPKPLTREALLAAVDLVLQRTK
jgi:DNA-binding response OmpR family regulator